VVTPAVREEFRQELAYWRADALGIRPRARPPPTPHVHAPMQRPPPPAHGRPPLGAGGRAGAPPPPPRPGPFFRPRALAAGSPSSVGRRGRLGSHHRPERRLI